MNKQKVLKYINVHRDVNKSALQKLDNISLQSKILKDFGIKKSTTENMSKQNLVGMYRNLYLSGLMKVKED
jgi:hypothetical protein